jgi:hypothetical protein
LTIIIKWLTLNKMHNISYVIKSKTAYFNCWMALWLCKAFPHHKYSNNQSNLRNLSYLIFALPKVYLKLSLANLIICTTFVSRKQKKDI